MLRQKVKNFKDLIKNPELAAEVTMMPVKELGVDAAIIFSDILVIAEAMGMNYEIVESKGPVFEQSICDEKVRNKLKIANPEQELSFVSEAIRGTKTLLNNTIPLIGFAGAPWTIFAYFADGGSSKSFTAARRMIYSQPEIARQTLDMITQSTIAYIKAQITAGADIIQLFDSWAGVLPHKEYQEFGLRYIAAICNEIKKFKPIPLIVFIRGNHSVTSEVSAIKCDVIGLDWTVNISDAKKTAPDKTLQGNMDPALLYADKKTIKKATSAMLNAFGRSRHIANLGHGVYPDTPLYNVKCFIDAVKNHRLL